MPTKTLYLNNSYQQTETAKIVSIEQRADLTAIVLDQTIFYPQGGGQPTDLGIIAGNNGKLTVEKVEYNQGNILHLGQLDGSLQTNEEVALQIDWQWRYQNMINHTIGHLIDACLRELNYQLQPSKGYHFPDGPYVEYMNSLDETQINQLEIDLQRAIIKAIDSSSQITTKEADKEYISKHCDFVPSNLPENKTIRVANIHNHQLPCGGTHVNSLNELGNVSIKLKTKKGKLRITYKNTNPNKNQEEIETQTIPSNNPLTAKIQQLKEQLMLEKDTKELETKYLGKKGLYNQLAKQIKGVDDKMRKQLGEKLNQLKTDLAKLIQEKNKHQTSADDYLDLSIQGQKPNIGHTHPISQAMEEITRIFEQIGFTRVRYPEVDWDWYAFESLNMPKSHPARDEWETFFVDAPINQQKGKMVLTPHTSNGQVREMERLGKPPIRMINIARCYRRQQDTTHTQMFHQFEGLVVDKGINIQHLKGTLDYFAEQFYGAGTKSRIRPFHFRFTEPSFEVDFSCHICHGSGEIIDLAGKKQKCKFCKSGWHEVGGAGMVHPNVLRAGGIDPEEYTGFAFGWGIERTYTLKEGLNIDDIRLLYSADMRFLRQF